MNRLISIALRRTLGKYFILQDSELLQGLESDLVNGRVVLSGLVLDPSVRLSERQRAMLTVSHADAQ